MDELTERKTNSDPDVRLRVGQSLVWNAERDLKIQMVRQGVNPGRLPTHDGFYAISFHTSMNAAYTTQNTMRKRHPDMETHVHKVTGRDWVAEIHIKVRENNDG